MIDDLGRQQDSIDRQRERQRIRQRDERLAITQGCEQVLAAATPPLIIPDGEVVDGPTLCDYLQVSRTALLGITRRHRDELVRVGFQPSHDGRAKNLFSARAVLHICLLFTAGTSERANHVAGLLGVQRQPVRRTSGNPMATQVSSCNAILERAYTLISAVRERAPEDVWDLLEDHDRWQLQALIVALSALVPDDVPDLRRYLSDLGEARRSNEANEAFDAARGLALLIPVTHKEFEQ